MVVALLPLLSMLSTFFIARTALLEGFSVGLIGAGGAGGASATGRGATRTPVLSSQASSSAPLSALSALHVIHDACVSFAPCASAALVCCSM
jgi:hypothetical protein